ncbi:MAG: glutathione S-transferase family protein [Myxococcota bacterium]
MTDDLTLISFNLCPFVQRAAVALREQGRAYDIEYIDLRDKPQWFLEISPSGKVPLLKVGDRVIFESNVILNYLDETTSGPRLFAEDPLERATERMWIEFISALMAKGWSLQAAPDEAKARELCADVRERLKRLTAVLPEPGPLWGGERLTMVDVAVGPILQRFTWAETLEPTLGLFEGLPRLQAWRDALLDRPSLTASILPDLEAISAQMLNSIGSWIARRAGT